MILVTMNEGVLCGGTSRSYAWPCCTAWVAPSAQMPDVQLTGVDHSHHGILLSMTLCNADTFCITLVSN